MSTLFPLATSQAGRLDRLSQRSRFFSSPAPQRPDLKSHGALGESASGLKIPFRCQLTSGQSFVRFCPLLAPQLPSSGRQGLRAAWEPLPLGVSASPGMPSLTACARAGPGPPMRRCRVCLRVSVAAGWGGGDPSGNPRTARGQLGVPTQSDVRRPALRCALEPVAERGEEIPAGRGRAREGEALGGGGLGHPASPFLSILVRTPEAPSCFGDRPRNPRITNPFPRTPLTRGGPRPSSTRVALQEPP